jgi:hypothetical protein
LKVAASLRTYEYIEGVEHWHDIRGYWKGSCYGFAVAALLAFNNHQAFSNDFPRVSPAGLDIYSLDCTGSVRDMINTVFTKQYKSQEYGIDNLTGHISSVLKIIKIYLSKTQDPLDAVFWLGRKQNVSKHAIIPIALEKPFPATDYEDLIVYDPGQEQIVKLDLKHDTFFYRGYATDETNHIGFSEPLSNFYD